MTESAYLKSSVGPVLANAVAETVLAQPSNPQEYLALYLLHVLQEEERRDAAAALKTKAEVQRQMWASERALREKRAADTIQRFYRQCKRAIQLRRESEEALWTTYQEAEEEAEQLLDEEEVADAASRAGGAARDLEDTGGTADVEGGDEANGGVPIEDAAAAVEETRRDFYKAQRFMLHIRKALIGTLKKELLDQRGKVRVEQDRMYDLLDRAEAEVREKEEAEFVASATAGALPSSAAAAELAEKSAVPRHEHIPAAMIMYRVLRCWCYIFFDSTPKQTDTPAKVSALVKPFTFMQLLRAFNPVATYHRNRPLRLENVGKQDEEEGGADDLLQESGGEPLQQPKPRQARRVSRILRVLMHDGEYVSTVNPADYIDADEEVENEESAASARGAELASLVEAAAKNHSVMLYALLRLLRTASAYRDARDHWVTLLQQNGHDAPSSEEMPEDDETDPNNEEGLRDDDGEVDEAAVRRLLITIGTDTDEALAKLWANQDDVERKKWQAMAAARYREEEEETATNEDGEEDGGDVE
ncbi:hypothetical protein TraAM80_04377 [Trypanosoma rangeli]|uniref:Uncharacterized protein n=1 Tax=Trypanosoma rangeli TaxID=5698 RepID=A0A422NJV4_TRYRA|nr:uncharacterized protein TraAM80_04377 [Trypanosoma rangeli]RNF05753.1 hypothetical protein TraAM80_04377 [Trypanosoma rangeli]|eukprot:RNF05753.1 hypothetical protein TraAM80_04377 [Trypanosoma rangeli]